MEENNIEEPEFSRRRNEKKIPKDRAENMARSIDQRIGRTANFNDVVEVGIKTKGYQDTEDVFEVIKEIWKVAGRDVSNATEVYDKHFGETKTLLKLAQDALEPIETQEEIEQVNEVVVKKVQRKKVKEKAVNNSVSKLQIYLLSGTLLIINIFCFQWFFHIGHHIKTFYNEIEKNSLPFYLLFLFFTILCISVYSFTMNYILVRIYSKKHKNIKEIWNKDEGGLGNIIFGLFLLLGFYSMSPTPLNSSKYINNYYAISLDTDDHKGSDLVNFSLSIPDSVYDSFWEINNRTFYKEKFKSDTYSDIKLIQKHVNDAEFLKTKYIFKGSAVIEGYDTTYVGYYDGGFKKYFISLVAFFIETIYRFIIFTAPFFIIIQLFLFYKKHNENKN